MSEKDFVWIDAMELTKPRHGVFEVIVNSWWIINDKGQICLYKNRYPQCNRSESISRAILNSHMGKYGGTDVIQIPVVFIRHRCD